MIACAMFISAKMEETAGPISLDLQVRSCQSSFCISCCWYICSVSSSIIFVDVMRIYWYLNFETGGQFKICIRSMKHQSGEFYILGSFSNLSVLIPWAPEESGLIYHSLHCKVSFIDGVGWLLRNMPDFHFFKSFVS